MVQSTRITDGSKTVDVRYFITSLTNVETAAKSMRSHWGIENNLHWTPDLFKAAPLLKNYAANVIMSFP
jgi:predicted transposase YbfD/YdcC